MFCPKCGVENLNTSRFCKKCGKNLPDAAQVRQATPPGYGYAPPQQSVNLLGQVLDGKYRIDARLGAGGMGDVYRATRLLIGDSVAIKVLHAHLARDSQAAERFRREAVTATQLRHRNIVALYDVGISAVHHVPYILMELAEGFSLRQIINQYRVLPLDFVVTVTAQVCAALDEAHRLGIVHRDIKPENIIANQTANGWHVKILDFGIAKLYNQSDLGLTQDGSAMGTPQYMSPEQCMGEQLDGRSDLYSVGIMLYEMLSGSVPFKSPAASAIAVHQVQTPPAPPRSLNPNIPPQVEEVVLRALEKRRELRQQTPQKLSQELIQAATNAFKAGVASVSAVPIAAPDVEPEFDAEGEAGTAQPPASHTLSSEILVENEPPDDDLLGVIETKSEAAPTEKPIEKPAENLRVEAALENAAEKTEIVENANGNESAAPAGNVSAPLESGSIFDELDAPSRSAPPQESSRNQELSLVFEDAEHLLDDIFPDEKTPLHDASKAQSSATVSAIGDHRADVSEQDFHSEEQSREVAAEPLTAAALSESPLAGEIESKPENNNKLFIFGAIALLSVFVLIGAIALGVWYFAGQRAAPSAAIEAPAPDTTRSKDPPAGMAYVPGGEFTMGSSAGDEFSGPAHRVSVKPFFIDLTEVTNEEYKKFTDAAKYKTPPDWKNGTFPEGRARLPVTGVDWDAANAYAKWAGKRLPTEEEWEYAARGTDERQYPWGNEWKKEFANADKQTGGMSETGKFAGKSPFGLVDMSGNAWEWTATDAKAYPNGKMLPNESIEPKIIRGGYFGSSKDKATVTFRRPYGARGEADGYANTGFRCVKDAPAK